MPFKKNWEYTELFNYHFLTMKEKGVMERSYQRNMEERETMCPKEHIMHRIVKDPRPVGINKTFSLYILLFVGVVAALIFLLAEAFYAKCQH